MNTDFNRFIARSTKAARLPRLLSALALATLAGSAIADVQLPAILSNGMVLQQQTSARLWGWANPNESIRVTPNWPDAKPVDGKADGRGHWEIKVQTPPAGGPYSITIAGENQLTISDILVGEVWVCSGQSNMEWPLRSSFEPNADIASASNPSLRLYTVPKLKANAHRNSPRARFRSIIVSN